MAAYDKAFRAHGGTVGQVLLTRDDFSVRSRYLNAKRTFSALFSQGIIPIINENDTVAIDEIRLGDNDNLSAFVAHLIGAELLILLSDVDGLYSDDPSQNEHAMLIPVVEKVTPAIEKHARESGTDRGTGGMVTKLQAARTCSSAGIAMIIANGSRPNVLEEIFSGTFRGTLFLPAHTRLNTRKHWIGFVAHTRGEIVIDDGAVSAILHRHSSLLPGGIVKVAGRFNRGDTVSLQTLQGREIARGIVTLSSQELAKVKGMKTSAVRAALGVDTPVETIHKDNLAILETDV
jgi:glutamate 5-kinase